MTMRRRDFLRETAGVAIAVSGGAMLGGVGGSARAMTPSPLRPPGSLDEARFVSTCIRCMRCVDACPNHCLESLSPTCGSRSAGTPAMFPRKAACMLCANEQGDYLKCTIACPSGALRPVRKTAEDIRKHVAIGIAEIDLNLCYSYNNWSCGACYRACPLAGEAMTVGAWERPVVHSEACVGCGCCERSCIRYPHAIRVRKRDS